HATAQMGAPAAYRVNPSYTKMLRNTPDGPIKSAAMARGVVPRVTAHGARSTPACDSRPIIPKMPRLIRSVCSGSAMRPKPYAALAKDAASKSPVSHVSTKNSTRTLVRSAKPGHLAPPARLEGLDRGQVLERQLDLVAPAQEPVLPERVHLETEDAGTTARRPRATSAAARRSSMRLLVQEPMKTRLTGVPSSGAPGVSPMYASARSTLWRRAGSPTCAGSGTCPVIGSASCGLVPHVTVGAMAAASSLTSRSKTASESDGSVRHDDSARSHMSPRGAKGRPSRYEKVTSSGATMPARAPPSTDMLQTVLRSSTDIARRA